MLRTILPKRTDLGIAPGAVYALKAAHTRARSITWRLAGGSQPDARGFRILYYHRVSDDSDELAVTPRRFREQIACLADQGYRGVDVVTALGAAPGAVALAFDDGYADIADHALPELERHGFSATVFLATGVTDGRARFSWYDRQPPLLGWDDVARLDGGAFRFEAHTVTHPNLLALGDAEARDEIAGSKRELEERLGREVTAFCYPAGFYADRDVLLAAEAGYTPLAPASRASTPRRPTACACTGSGSTPGTPCSTSARSSAGVSTVRPGYGQRGAGLATEQAAGRRVLAVAPARLDLCERGRRLHVLDHVGEDLVERSLGPQPIAAATFSIDGMRWSMSSIPWP